MLTSENSKKLYDSAGKTPLVKGMGFKGSLFNFAGIGLSYKLSLDAFIGFAAPVFYIDTSGNDVVIEPQFYVEGSTHNYIQFDLGMFSYRINGDFTGYKYTFADVQYVWSIDNPKEYCYELGWNAKALSAEVSTEQFVNECQFGIAGFLTGKTKKCRSRRYIPEEAFYLKQFSDKYDKSGTY